MKIKVRIIFTTNLISIDITRTHTTHILKGKNLLGKIKLKVKF